MSHAPSWELYRSFLSVLQEGSLSGAARALDLTQPTVGRHIDALEQALGFSLFTRSQQGFRPTEAALALQPYAESLESTTAALLRVAASQVETVSGTVRITASEAMATEVLPAILVQLRRGYPQLAIELVASNRIDNLLQREADIAVRMQRPSQQALIAKYLGQIALGAYAHRDYLAQYGTPAALSDLKRHTLIGFDRETAYIRQMKAELPDLDREAFALRTDSHQAAMAALRAGFGIGICQVGIAARDPNLVRLLPDWPLPKMDTWLAMHEDLRDSARCRVAFQALAQGLTDYVQTAQTLPHT